MTRIWQLILLIALILPTDAIARVESAQVTLDYVATRAEQRARKPFRSPRVDLPEILRPEQLNYDGYRDIKFRHEKALWLPENLPFRVEYFHLGYLYQEPVRLNEFTATHVQPIRFAQDVFNYGNSEFEKQIPSGMGYAGFRLLHELNGPGKWGELGSFLGSSYFRLLGKGQRYGQSARGLAIDSGEPDRPEEFPLFTDWWLGKPQPGDDRLRLFAILDSVSCVGAYEFTLLPGETTVADVTVVLYFREQDKVREVVADRRPIMSVGMAPLTSMFWFGKSSERKFSDYRPEVHDSDGLLIHMGDGEVLWRPLNNATVIRHQRFAGENIRGFGLLQRERDFSSYQDLFNLYHKVPNVWVETRGHWGQGEVHLLELPTHYEGLDNIVAFWDPKTKPTPLAPFKFGYTLHWTLGEDGLKLATQDRVIATWVGVDPSDSKRRQFAIDFAGPRLDVIDEASPPKAISSSSTNAAIVDSQVFRNPFRSTWRVMLTIEPAADGREPVDIRCALQNGEEVVSETWTYLWSPP